MIDFICWWLSTLWCKHEIDTQGVLQDCGMSKAWHCKKCGICMKRI